MQSRMSPPSRFRRRPDAMTAFGCAWGLICGAIIGYKSGGRLGIIVGAICGLIAGMGIGGALAPPSPQNALGTRGRFALAGISTGIATVAFLGFCILPLHLWNGLWSSGTETNRVRETKDNIPVETTEQHKQRIIRELLHARRYAKESYEGNKKIVDEVEALQLYRKDLANIEQEANDKGVELPPGSG